MDDGAEPEPVREIVYETHLHTSGPYTPNYPPQHQVNETGSFLSRALGQVKEKWSGQKGSQKQVKPVSLFVSERGENVAVVARNCITILQKGDNYRHPSGTFSSKSFHTIIYGAWSEVHNVFGFVDDLDNIHFIKSNGEEITRLAKRGLKVSLPIIGLISHAAVDAPVSCMCCFSVLTSDGRLHRVEVGQDSTASVSLAQTSCSTSVLRRQFPQSVFCFDFHQELCLLVVIGSIDGAHTNKSGCCLSVWSKSKASDLVLSLTSHIEGVYSRPKGSAGKTAYPKVLFSSSGRFVASVDITGSLYIFKLDNCHSLFPSLDNKRASDGVDQSIEGKKVSEDVTDFTWWSECVVTFAHESGRISMVHVLSGSEVSWNAPTYSLPVIERVQSLRGHVFILQTKMFDDRCNASDGRGIDDSYTAALSMEDLNNQLLFSKMHWSLLSFEEKSITEMYNILIAIQDYQAAVDLANRHGLDKDEILKAQWSNCERKTSDISMYLSKIKDQAFVLSECLDKVGAAEDAERALLACGLRITDQYRFSESQDHDSGQLWNFRIKRIQLLQFKDKLETFLGINMGRFSALEFKNFLSMLTHQVATTLAETGKIGALNLLFKRHPYSLVSSMMDVLSSIPETIPVESYSQLLPGRSSPGTITLRGKDWVECARMASYLKKLPDNKEIILQIGTELILHEMVGTVWPSPSVLSSWYRNRAREIDKLSGQLENCLNLVDFGCCKDLHELQILKEDISFLHQLIYCSNLDSEAVSLSLVEWEQLSDYQKFKLMVESVLEDNVIERLQSMAIPFMRSRYETVCYANNSSTESRYADSEIPESFLVKWLKEIAAKNKLDICLKVMEEGCSDVQSKCFFRDENEAVDCALHCIYRCTVLDSWNKMTAILLKLTQLQRFGLQENISRSLKVAEGHIEAGRLLAYYQVSKPLNFFREADSDGKNVKQILRLILSKFSRRQPARGEDDWATMWRDMQTLREKAFPFLDLEYMLIEFCRGLLKAGKFALARNYLKGTANVALPFEKAENIVIQSAREYFFSASSLACSEIWKAKECLNLLPSSPGVKAEADIIDALTLRLPNLGVTILPVQFKQIKDPMEVVRLAITSQSGAYLHVNELIEIAKLLGLKSEDEVSAIEDAVAREAAVAGDLQLAFDLCLILARKGHGSIWDLCAAIARGPALENMDINSRKQLLGFALSHCDEESIGELMHAWKDLDMQDQCDRLMMSTGTSPENPSHISHTAQFNARPELIDGHANDVANTKDIISKVAESMPVGDDSNWESFLVENGKLLSFATLQLPWLLDLSENRHLGEKSDPGNMLHGKRYVSARVQALLTIFSWLARNKMAPKDSLIDSFARSLFEPPVSYEDDIIGCSVLLNLVDAFSGVQVIEEQLKVRQNYQDISSIMKLGMTYGLVHSVGVYCKDPPRRRELILRMFKEKQTQLTSAEIDKIGTVDSTFWREWKFKLEEQKRMADHSRVLQQVLPGVDATCFLSGDITYIEDAVFTLIESLKLEKKHILKKLLFLAHTYSVDVSKVLQKFMHSVLVSDLWTNEDITVEITDVKEDLIASTETISLLSLQVYPKISGCNKQRLSYIYGLLSDCFLKCKGAKDVIAKIFPDKDLSPSQIGQYYKIMEQECQRVAFIEKLNFKNIAGLGGLNFECLRNEVYSNMNDTNLESLAQMVENIGGLFSGVLPNGLLSYKDVYKYHALKILIALENRALAELDFGNHEKFIGFVGQLEQAYDASKAHIVILGHSDALEIITRYLKIIAPLDKSLIKVQETSIWQECLVVLLNFWIRLIDDMSAIAALDPLEQNFFSSSEAWLVSLKVLVSLVLEDMVSPSEGWGTVVRYVNYGTPNDFSFNFQIFCESMVFSGCDFGAISEVYRRVVPPSLTGNDGDDDGTWDLPHVYSTILEPVLQDLNHGSSHQQNLFHILSSLSNLGGDLEDLARVRIAVWEKLTKLSDNYQISGDVRVLILEVLQLISGSSVRGYSAKLHSQVLPWEGWNDKDRLEVTTASHGIPARANNPDRLASNLVALRSSQVAASISPGTEISPDDLSTVETAVTCFMKLSEAASTRPHVDALITILEEWDGVFTIPKAEATLQASDHDNNWGNNDWDEGWESFEEEAPTASEKNGGAPAASHPLHVCWMEVLKKLATLSYFRDILKLVDKSLVKSNVILDENSAQSLISVLVDIDSYVALKLALLLPYEAMQLRCLDVIDGKLKQDGVSESLANDQELLILLLASGVLSTIITKPQYGTTFSYLCYLVGSLSRHFQEDQLAFLKTQRKAESVVASAAAAPERYDFLLLFINILFPCFVAELVKADQQVLASFLVTKFMHTTSALSLINIAESSLRSFLERQHKALEGGERTPGKTGCAYEILVNTIMSLRDKSQSLISSALSMNLR